MASRHFRAAVPNLFGTTDWFHGSRGWWGGRMTRDRAQVSLTPQLWMWRETGGGARVNFACGPVFNRPQTGTGLWPRDWGPLLEGVLCIYSYCPLTNIRCSYLIMWVIGMIWVWAICYFHSSTLCMDLNQSLTLSWKLWCRQLLNFPAYTEWRGRSSCTAKCWLGIFRHIPVSPSGSGQWNEIELLYIMKKFLKNLHAVKSAKSCNFKYILDESLHMCAPI